LAEASVELGGDRPGVGEHPASDQRLDAIAVTRGPGLAGSLLVGVNAAKGLALASGLPLIGINHIEAHIYGNWLVEAPPPEFPLICLVVSGGHTELILMTGHGQYRRLPYPGGPSIQEAARAGSATAFKLPRAWLPGSYNFSFSGLKTAVLRIVQKYEPQADGGPRSKARTVSSQMPPVVRVLPVANLAASFQAAVVDVLVEKTCQAADEFGANMVLLAGGVAANTLLREEMSRRSPVPVRYPPVQLCTDNAAIIASTGFYRYEAGERAGWDLDVNPSLRLVERASAPQDRDHESAPTQA
jgi:N6-L-threonylcarbamoyladenine synthase